MAAASSKQQTCRPSSSFNQQTHSASPLQPNADTFYMDGECDLKQRCCAAATATLPLASVAKSSIVIDAPRTFSRPFFPRGIQILTHSLSPAPSLNTQSFDATIEVDGVTGVLSKSNLLLQGVNALHVDACYTRHHRLLLRQPVRRHTPATMRPHHRSGCLHGTAHEAVAVQDAARYQKLSN
jgi:hypothetical protein